MIEIKRLKELEENELNNLFHRFGDDFTSIMTDTVIPIVNDVKKNGDNAVKKYTEKYDSVKLKNIQVTEKEIDLAYKNIPKEIINAFNLAKNNIEEFHLHQIKNNIIYTRDDETTLGVIYQPIEYAAIYTPGGKATYPSSILMGVIPALIAGVKNISIITPPNKEGKISDIILATCKIVGIERIYKIGGAQGIAAVGFGTESINKADIIVGPGNIYVTAAKTYLFSLGLIQIDSMAGPSEILIIADETANPNWIACDLLSQAEHEEMAIPLLVTTSEELAIKVKKHIITDIESNTGRHSIKKKAISDNGLILLVDSIEEAISFSNRFSPEHMELMILNPLEYLFKIKNVGSLFLGPYSPVAIGDYFSGTNHILPTGGASRFSSGLSVDTFTRRTSFQLLTKVSLERAKGPVNIMSKIEGFEDKHGGSVNIRFKKE